MKVKKQVIAFALSVCALGNGLSAARAQGGAAVENTRLFVELKTSTLYDAVQLVQNAVGRTDYEFADEAAAKATLIPAKTFNNAAWDNIIRNITNENGFKIVPQSTGKKSIELRAPVMNYGGEGGYPGGPGGYPSGAPGGYPGGGGGFTPAGGGIPANPFGARRPRTQTQTFAAPQTAPGLAGTANAEGKDYRLLPVQHVYVGGIAKLFGEGEVISTEDFLLPEGALGGRGGGGGGGGFGSGGGGIGITQGFGGNQGGGGFGGGGGGFGGGGGGFGGVGGFGGTNNAVGGGFGF